MLSSVTRFTTVSPAQYQRINQVSLLLLIGSAAIAPAWVNIAMVAGYSIMNWLTFKQLVVGVIDRVLGQQPAQRQPTADEIRAQRWAAEDAQAAERRRPSTGNTHKYYGAGDMSRPGRYGKRIDRQFRVK